MYIQEKSPLSQGTSFCILFSLTFFLLSEIIKHFYFLIFPLLQCYICILLLCFSYCLNVIPYVFVLPGCYNKIQQIITATNNRNLSLTVLDAEVLD